MPVNASHGKQHRISVKTLLLYDASSAAACAPCMSFNRKRSCRRITHQAMKVNSEMVAISKADNALTLGLTPSLTLENTSMGKVAVLGTEFNVKQRGSFFEVTCFEGKVQVTRASDKKILMAGDLLRYSNGQLELGSIKDDEPSWTRNLSSFQNVKLSEVLAELERQYGVKVMAAKVNTDTLFTGGFVHDDLENALISITEPLELNFTLENSNQVSLYPREN